MLGCWSIWARAELTCGCASCSSPPRSSNDRPARAGRRAARGRRVRSAPTPSLTASRKTNSVADQKSHAKRSEEKPRRRTTVAHVNASMPRPFPALSLNTTMQMKRFKCFSGVAAALRRPEP